MIPHARAAEVMHLVRARLKFAVSTLPTLDRIMEDVRDAPWMLTREVRRLAEGVLTNRSESCSVFMRLPELEMALEAGGDRDVSGLVEEARQSGTESVQIVNKILKSLAVSRGSSAVQVDDELGLSLIHI